MDTDQIKNLLEKYQQGTCTKAEAALFEEWLAEVKNDSQEHFNDDFINYQLAITKTRIDNSIGKQPATGSNPFNILSIAAAVLILLSAAAVVWSLNSKKPVTDGIAAQPAIKQYINSGWVFVQTSKGITDHIKLVDGSEITLDASSTLRYPVKFTNHKRPIFLDEGEALFEVAKDKTSPFTVYTKKFATTALGTAFNIRSYASEHKISISLIHGKIKVEDLHPIAKTRQVKILLPHQQLVLNKISGQLLTSDFKDDTPVTAWKDGVLSFNNASLDEVVNSIDNRFNVSIINKSTHTNWSYTGTFKDESLADVLKTVCLTEELTYSIHKNNITLN